MIMIMIMIMIIVMVMIVIMFKLTIPAPGMVMIMLPPKDIQIQSSPKYTTNAFIISISGIVMVMLDIIVMITISNMI